jgi:hypothetical protein
MVETLDLARWSEGCVCRRAAALRGITRERQRRKLTRELYLSLDEMVVAFGLATPLRKHGTI